MIRVKIHLPGGVEQALEFQKNSIMIGRAAANDVCIDQGGVSRYHATISVEGDALVVQDLGSTNGTLIGGKKIQSSQITNGDRIVLGDIAVELDYVADSSDSSFGDLSSQGTPVNSTLPPTGGTLAGTGSGGHGFDSPPQKADAEPVAPPKVEAPPAPQAGPSRPPGEVKRPTIHNIERPDGLLKKPTGSHDSPAAPAEPPPAPVTAEKANTTSGSSKKSEAAPAAPPPPEPEKISRDQSNNAFFWQALESFLAPVWHYITDDGISEIMINGPAEVYIEKKGRLVRVSETFSPEQLQAAILNIAQFVGRRVSEEEPYLDARLPDGSRVAVLMPPCSRKGASLAIRKFSKEKLTVEKLMDFGSLSPQMVTYLQAAVMLKKNVVISGGTSSGKTSLLNVVSGLIPDDERILTIEDSAELQLRQEHVLPMETKPADKKGRGLVTIRDLVKASLRMRPDRIVVGEIRGGEALDLLQAMNTGHSGSMTTVHASSPQQALTRLETLSLFSGIEIPLRALREQVSTAIEVIIQASRLPDHSRKVTHISEVCKLNEAGDYVVSDIFRFAREGSDNGKIIGKHVWTGAQSNMQGEMELCGLTEALAIFSGPPPKKGVQYQAAGH